jgi:hypothetical protein
MWQGDPQIRASLLPARCAEARNLNGEAEMRNRFRGALVAVTAAATMAGCAGNTLGALGEVLGTVLSAPAGGGADQRVAVEIRSVDTRQQLIQVATQEGQTGAVRYDANTVVVYQNQQYPVTALERGDLVTMQLQDVQGSLYTPRIDVQQSVQDRGGAAGGAGSVVQLTGRVAQIDQNAGAFLLQTQQGNVTVALPRNPPQATVDYFRRLRNGDTVRLEAVPVSQTRVEIHRFL